MPDTLKQVVDRVKAAKTEIANAITDKGGTVSSGDGLEEFAADIATIPSGGGTSQPRKDVNFYDYDGTIVNSYTAAEFANLTAMPDNPSHDGLTAQGWNWSLNDAKTYVASNGKLEIGQMYVTDDGNTRLYIILTEGRTSPILQLYLNANSELDIDWGDGSTHSTFMSTSAGYKSERHNYASAGNYVIVIAVITGSFDLTSSASFISSIIWDGNNSQSSPDLIYNCNLQKVYTGNNVTSIGNAAFSGCRSLFIITISSSITSIDGNAFANCRSLTYITVPNSITSIHVSSFVNCYSLSHISMPNSVTSALSFTNCYLLSTITIPSSVTSIGSNAFNACSALSHISIPSSVTSIGSNAFNGCYSLSHISMPNSVTSISNNTFSNCYGLATITIDKPEGSISGSPWGASTSAPTSTQIIWTGE